MIGEIGVPLLSNDDHIFNSHAPQMRVVEARLDGDNVATFEDVAGC